MAGLSLFVSTELNNAGLNSEELADVVLMLEAVVAFALLFTGSLLAEFWLNPRPQPFWQRPVYARRVHLGILLCFYAVVLLLFQRPWFAAATGLALVFLLLLVNNVKMASLREPFIHQDFEYFSDTLRHPRLYLPFFGLWRTLLAVAVIAAFMVTGFKLEAGFDSLVAGLICSLCAGVAGLLCLYHRQFTDYARTLTLDPVQDLRTQGFFSLIGLYTQLHLKTEPPASLNPLLSVEGVQPEGDLVVIQSESFFDPRECYSFIKRDVLEHFDRITAEAYCKGKLHVPVWGANTVRTEFAFLSALEPSAFGVRQFNPYHWLAVNRMQGTVSELRALGYRTVCIHPYSADFYRRSEVYPNLGFDEFIDIKAFDQSDIDGQYTGDLAVAKALNGLLNHPKDSRPVFVFVITMENHGPLHLEKPDPMIADQVYSGPPPEQSDDLTVYLRHLKNADLMLKRITDNLASRERKATLCWYGDHVPIMDTVYQKYGAPQGHTRYLIWQNRPTSAAPASRVPQENGEQKDCDVQSLFARLLVVADPDSTKAKAKVKA